MLLRDDAKTNSDVLLPISELGLIQIINCIDIIHDDRQIPEKELPVAKFGRDSVLPACWHPSSIIHALGNVSKTEEMEIDAKTQIIYLFGAIRLIFFGLEVGITQFTQDIILTEGEIRPKEGYDLSDLYQYIHFDGVQRLNRHSGKKQVHHAIRAWICIRDQALYICDG